MSKLKGVPLKAYVEHKLCYIETDFNFGYLETSLNFLSTMVIVFAEIWHTE